eukprot:scaffold1689_cov60-Phaeocystis_antarctica.AAC.1
MPATSLAATTFPSPPSAARRRALCAWLIRSRTAPCRAAIRACAASARSGCRTAPTVARRFGSGCMRVWSEKRARTAFYIIFNLHHHATRRQLASDAPLAATNTPNFYRGRQGGHLVDEEGGTHERLYARSRGHPSEYRPAVSSDGEQR